MTSIRPAEKKHQAGSTLSHGSTLSSRFYSARIAPEKPSDHLESRILSAPTSPGDFQVHEWLRHSNESTPRSPISENKIFFTPQVSSTTSESPREPVVKISEYKTPENTPFEPVTETPAPKKLNRYILVTPRTIFSMSLLTFLSLAVVLIGLGITISNRQAQLNSKCPSLTYCPMNSSFNVLCNMSNEYCGCYNAEDKLIGCFKQRYYGQACYRAEECSSNYNLRCNMSLYQCECLDHYFYNGSICIPRLTYGAQCSTLNDMCDYLLNLTCLSGNTCTCNTNVTFWNGQYCELYRTLNKPCDPYKNPTGCSSTFLCNSSTATCRCQPSAYFDGKACLSYSTYLEPCYDVSSCLPHSELLCLWGLCQCNDLYYYWSPLLSKCIYPKHITYNASCYDENTCESDYGLRCINGRCVCEVNSYWTPGNYCDFQSIYSEQCVTAPCLANTGLICSANTSKCTCPQFYYWDNFVCQYQRTYTGFCVYDSWCRMDLGLRCRGFQCTCSLCTTCFWDGVRCRDCPTSWQILRSNGTMQPRVYCYVKVDSYVNWNESVVSCATAATSFFGGSSHLIYLDDLQELQDVSAFATNDYYDIFIGHTNSFNYSQWFLANGTISPTFQRCTGVASSFSNLTCTRILTTMACVTDIACYGWTSRFICELD